MKADPRPIVSVSVSSQMDEADQTFHVWEFHRVARPSASNVVTVHRERALDRAMEQTGLE
jgi:hypothetical protein